MTYDLSSTLKMVLAGRVDLGCLFDPQFSPKAALVLTPSPNHSFRFTVNQAFQTPNYSEFYLRALAGIGNLSALEAGLRASPLGPALAGVPDGQLFTCLTVGVPGSPACNRTSSVVPINARGNSKLDVEKNTGYELGWRGDLSRKFFASVDAYYNRLSNFVTDLLPGVNSAFAFWTAPTSVPTAARVPLETAVRHILLEQPGVTSRGTRPHAPGGRKHCGGALLRQRGRGEAVRGRRRAGLPGQRGTSFRRDRLLVRLQR